MSFELGPLDPESKVDDTGDAEIVPAVELPAIPSTPEETLGVQAAASPKEIRDAYYAKAKLYHPSRNGNSLESQEWMRALVAARDTLLHPKPKPSVPSREQIKKEFQNRNKKEIIRKRMEHNASKPPFNEQNF